MNDLSKFGAASALGGLGAGLGSFLGGDPYKAARKYYDQIPGATRGNYDPYINAGRGALDTLQGQYGQLIGNLPGLQGQYNQLMQDPGSVFNKIGGGYQQSPGYQFALDQAMGAGKNAAAAGGMAGSPQHQQQAMQTATGLANQDYYNYMQNALGLYGQGLQGAGNLYGMGLQGYQGLNQMGFNASDQMSRIIADALSQQGNMAYAGQNARNQSIGNTLGGLGSLAGFFL